MWDEVFGLYGLRVLGETLFAEGPSGDDSARAHFLEALALAETLEMRPLVAHCHAGLGRLDRRTGKLIESEEHRASAAALYREMGMTYWLERAERELES